MAQRLRELLSASLDFFQRGEQLRPGAGDAGHPTRVGECLECGAPLASHFDQHNAWIGHGRHDLKRVEP